MTDTEKRLTILGHIAELRKRLIRSVIAVAVTTVFSFVFYQQIFELLLRPAQGVNLIFVEVTEMIGTVMRVCLATGVIIAVPYLTFEVVGFVTPALTRKERKYVYLALPWVGLMFAAGVAFGYFVLLPPALNFLLTFGSEIATPQIKIGNYISVVTRLLLAIGLVFELPVVTTLLARLGIVTSRWMAARRKVFIIGAFILAAAITPTIDPINQSLVAVPLIVLFEMSIWLARIVEPAKKKAESLSTTSA